MPKCKHKRIVIRGYSRPPYTCKTCAEREQARDAWEYELPPGQRKKFDGFYHYLRDVWEQEPGACDNPERCGARAGKTGFYAVCRDCGVTTMERPSMSGAGRLFARMFGPRR